MKVDFLFDSNSLHLGLLPGEGLQLPVVVEDGELDGVPPGVEAHGELRLTPGVGDPDELPPVLGGPPVAEGGHKAELLGQTLVKDSPKIEQEKCLTSRTVQEFTSVL